MLLHEINLWYVYKSPLCHFARPRPKDKFVVIACKDNIYALGFLINSELNAFLAGKPDWLACQAEIKGGRHRSLPKDGWIDCIDLYPFYGTDLRLSEGQVSDETRRNIMQAVQVSPTIVTKYKKMILGNN